MSDADRIAGIVNEWFQTLPTPAMQQRDRSRLIGDLATEFERLERVARTEIAEEIATAIEAKTEPIAISDVAVVDVAERTQLAYRVAARIAREHGKES